MRGTSVVTVKGKLHQEPHLLADAVGSELASHRYSKEERELDSRRGMWHDSGTVFFQSINLMATPNWIFVAL